MNASWTLAAVLAGTAGFRQAPVTDPADVTAGWIALVVILALAAATVLLWLSMRKQLRNVRFEEKDTAPRRPPGSPSEPPSS